MSINRVEVYANNGRRAEAVSRLPPGSLNIPIRVGDRTLLICMSQPLRAEPWAQGSSRRPRVSGHVVNLPATRASLITASWDDQRRSRYA